MLFKLMFYNNRFTFVLNFIKYVPRNENILYNWNGNNENIYSNSAPLHNWQKLSIRNGRFDVDVAFFI